MVGGRWGRLDTRFRSTAPPGRPQWRAGRHMEQSRLLETLRESPNERVLVDLLDRNAEPATSGRMGCWVPPPNCQGGRMLLLALCGQIAEAHRVVSWGDRMYTAGQMQCNSGNRYRWHSDGIGCSSDGSSRTPEEPAAFWSSAQCFPTSSVFFIPVSPRLGSPRQGTEPKRGAGCRKNKKKGREEEREGQARDRLARRSSFGAAGAEPCLADMYVRHHLHDIHVH